MNEVHAAAPQESLGNTMNDNVMMLKNAEDLIDGIYIKLKGVNVEERPELRPEGLLLNAILQAEQLSRIVGKLTEISKLLE